MAPFLYQLNSRDKGYFVIWFVRFSCFYRVMSLLTEHSYDGNVMGCVG